MVKHLLVPGGLGFIGSHTIIEILKASETVITIIDNMCNCFPDVLERVQTILKADLKP